MSALAPSSMTAVSGYHDEFINPTPKVNLFRSKHKQYHNFTLHTQIISSSNGDSVTTNNMGQTFNLHKAGHVATKAYLQTIIPDQTAISGSTADHLYFVNAVGYAMISTVELRVGNQTQESQSGRLMELMEEYSNAPGKRLKEMVGRYESESALIQAAKGQQVLITPLYFWCFRKYGDALPMIAMQGAEVDIVVRYNAVSTWTVNRGDDSYARPSTIASGITASLIVQYAYLDRCLSMYYMNTSRTLYYLATITQEHQFNVSATTSVGGSPTRKTFSVPQLSFNHPCKGFAVAIQDDANVDGTSYTKQGVGLKDIFDYSEPLGGESITSPALTLNGAHMWETNVLPGVYYRQVQAYESLERLGSRNIYWHNLGPRTFDSQTYGKFNMSRIDNKQFQFQHRLLTNAVGWIWGFAVNVFVVYNGSGSFPFKT